MSKINLKHGLWVMVADGEKALFLKNEGDGLYPNLRLVQRIMDDHPELELISAVQGRIGLDLARAQQPALVLVDLHLPDIGGRAPERSRPCVAHRATR